MEEAQNQYVSGSYLEKNPNWHVEESEWKARQVLHMRHKNRLEPQTVAEAMPSSAEIAANRWLPDSELAFYTGEYQRTGFQGGLQWYRCGTSGAFNAELQIFSGRTIDVPSCFISGKQDWGTYQRPGVYEAMQNTACTDMIGCHLVDGAGHWVQQEQPAEVSRLLLSFIKRAAVG